MPKKDGDWIFIYADPNNRNYERNKKENSVLAYFNTKEHLLVLFFFFPNQTLLPKCLQPIIIETRQEEKHMCAPNSNTTLNYLDK